MTTRILLSRKEAAAVAGVSGQTIYRLNVTGRLGFIRIGRAIRVDRAELERFFRLNTTPAEVR